MGSGDIKTGYETRYEMGVINQMAKSRRWRDGDYLPLLCRATRMVTSAIIHTVLPLWPVLPGMRRPKISAQN